MADGAVPNDGHGGVQSNYEQDNTAQERQSSTNRSTGAVQGRRRRRGLVLASGRVRPANARNLINPAQVTTANAQAGVRIVAGPANAGGAPRAVHARGGGVAIAPAPFGVGRNPAAIIQAGIANAADAGAIRPLVGVNVGGVAPANQAPAQLNLAIGGVLPMMAPPGPAPAQQNFDIEAGLSGPPLRRNEVGPFF